MRLVFKLRDGSIRWNCKLGEEYFVGIRFLQVHVLVVISQMESKSMRRRHLFRLLDRGQCNGINEWDSAWFAHDNRFPDQ